MHGARMHGARMPGAGIDGAGMHGIGAHERRRPGGSPGVPVLAGQASFAHRGAEAFSVAGKVRPPEFPGAPAGSGLAQPSASLTSPACSDACSLASPVAGEAAALRPAKTGRGWA